MELVQAENASERVVKKNSPSTDEIISLKYTRYFSQLDTELCEEKNILRAS